MFGSQNTQPYSPPRPLGQDYRRSASNEQAKTLALIYGRQRVGCEFISDVFDVRASAVNSGGKNSTRVGTNYYASFAVAVCHGPVTAFHGLYLNGDPVFTNNTKIFPVSLAIANNIATFQTANPHGLTSGESIVVYNANQVEFNGEFVITVVSATQFQYTIPGATIAVDTATPVSGTSIFAYVKLDPIYATGADSTEITIPDFGTATIYWGTQTQVADAYMAAASGVQHPPYYGVCYIVFRQLYLGFNQTNVQNIEVVVERTPSFTWMSNPLHSVQNGDANPACIAADLMLNANYGLGCDPDADLNTALFDVAAEQFYADNVAFSPIVNRPQDIASLLNDMLSMVDASVVVDVDGRLSLAMQRIGTLGVNAVGTSNLVDLPTFSPAQWSDVINETYLNFLDRDSGWQPDFVFWADTAGIYAKGRPDPQTLDKQFITHRALASKLVACAGQLAALPKNDGKLSLAWDAALFAALTPGAGFTFTYAARPAINGVYRVMARTLSDPAKPVFDVEVSLDRSYLYGTASATGVVSAVKTGDGVTTAPPPADAPVPDLTPIPGPTPADMVELPLALCPNRKPALAALLTRTSLGDSAAKIYLSRNYVFTGAAPDSYTDLATINAFAFYGQLTADFPALTPFEAVTNPIPDWAYSGPTADSTALTADSSLTVDGGPFPLVAGLALQLAGVDLILPDVSDFDGLANSLLLFVGDEIMSVAGATLNAEGNYTLLVIRGRFGTAIADHAAGDTVWVLPLSDLKPMQHPSFVAGQTDTFKVVVGSRNLSDSESFDVVFSGARW